MLPQLTSKQPRDRSAYFAAYYATHHEERLATQAAYHAARRDELNAAAKAYYAARREECKAASRAYYATHREQLRARSAAWAKANPDKVLARKHVRRARLRGVESERVLISVLFERDKGICGICKKRVYKNARDLFMRPSHDHILPVFNGGANTYANSRLTHLRCNIARGSRGTAQLRFL